MLAWSDLFSSYALCSISLCLALTSQSIACSFSQHPLLLQLLCKSLIHLLIQMAILQMLDDCIVSTPLICLHCHQLCTLCWPMLLHLTNCSIAFYCQTDSTVASNASFIACAASNTSAAFSFLMAISLLLTFSLVTTLAQQLCTLPFWWSTWIQWQLSTCSALSHDAVVGGDRHGR